MSYPVPENVPALSRAVRDAGGRALLVGGCVRDLLMNTQPKDWDVEVYDVEPAKLRALLDQFGPVNVVGEAFTVYKLGPDLDVSLPRRERKSGRGHRAFVIEGDPSMTIEEATRRRDFTINAILEDPLTGEIIDPFGGQKHIHEKILKAVSAETFSEDSLRVLRAAQLAARFEFDIDEGTVALCRAIDLTDLPSERIWGEVEKLLMRARRPSVGLGWLRKLGAIDQLFPEIASLIDVPQDPEWHPRLKIRSLDGYDVRSQVIALVRDHLKPGEFFKKRDEVGEGAFRRLARKCELDLLYRVARADSLGRNADSVPREKWYTAEAQEWFIQRAKELEVEQQPPAPILLGRHLLEMGLEPGPRVGEITKAIYEMQLDGRVSDLQEAKETAKQILAADERGLNEDSDNKF